MTNIGLFSKTEIKKKAIVYRIKQKLETQFFFLIESVVIHLHSTHLSYLLHFISTERECDIEHTHTLTPEVLFKSLLYGFHVANNLVHVILVGRGSCRLGGGWPKNI